MQEISCCAHSVTKEAFVVEVADDMSNSEKGKLWISYKESQITIIKKHRKYYCVSQKCIFI